MSEGKINIKDTGEYFYLKMSTSSPYNEPLATAFDKAKARAVCHGYDLDTLDLAMNEIINERISQ